MKYALACKVKEITKHHRDMTGFPTWPSQFPNIVLVRYDFIPLDARTEVIIERHSREFTGWVKTHPNDIFTLLIRCLCPEMIQIPRGLETYLDARVPGFI